MIGDIIGSVYEWNNWKDKRFKLFHPQCRMTDDSVMTAAVASALLSSDLTDLEQFKENLVAEMHRFGKAYPGLGYGPRVEKWLIQGDTKPYGSLANGSAMRVSPVAWVAETMEECLTLAKASAEVTHDHPEGIAGAQALAGAVFLAKMGERKEVIRDFVSDYYSLDFTLDGIREEYAFDVSCAGSVPQAIVAFLEATGYEDAIRNAVSIGGDSDTIACMTGAVAAAFYGIPKDIREEAGPFIDGEVRNVLDRFTRLY